MCKLNTIQLVQLVDISTHSIRVDLVNQANIVWVERSQIWRIVQPVLGLLGPPLLATFAMLVTTALVV